MTQSENLSSSLFGTGPFTSPYQQPSYSSYSQHHIDHQYNPTYFVREPLGKRPAEMREDGGPRAKRRFEKVSAQFEQFSIREAPERINNIGSPVSSEEDEEMDDYVDVESEEEDLKGFKRSEFFVEEPDEEPSKKIRLDLDPKLQEYLQMAKQQPVYEIPSSKASSVQGHELIVWRPPCSLNPFDDPTMKGRITEVDNDDIPLAIGDTLVNFPDDVSSSDMSSAGSSPLPSPPRIEEVTTDSPCSMEDESMEID